MWVRTLTRGWVPLDEYDPRWETDYDEIKPEADALAAAWSRLYKEVEQRSFLHELDSDWDVDEEEQRIFLARQATQKLMQEAALQAIENRLYQLGVRLMRPYEHWNEDERYMEMMERG